MELTAIRSVARQFGISTRTLRYYEEVGLIQSTREPGGSMRVYDAEALQRLKQILVLRALRLPLKEIQAILTHEDVGRAINALEAHARDVGSEVQALLVIREAVLALVGNLRDAGVLSLPDEPLADQLTHKLLGTLSVPLPINKEAIIMSKIKDARILYLPPATVCSVHCMGPSAENECGTLVDRFILDNNLSEVKPDFRLYGFNHPNGEKPDGSDHGYEFWITIPDDMALSVSYTKKQFEGGLYAAHMIPIGAFEEWEWIVQWVVENEEYDPRWGDPTCMNGLIEDHLNYINMVKLDKKEREGKMQLDLLVPIKPKAK